MSNKKNKNTVYDHFLKRRVDKNSPGLVEGVIYCKGSKLIFGTFTSSYLNCTVCIEDVYHHALSRTMFNTDDGFLSCDDGIVRLKQEMNIDDDFRYHSNDFKYRLDYNVTSSNISNKVNSLSKLEIDISSEVETFTKELDGLSVGVEIETTSGFLPYDLLYKSNLIPLRDGSITGLEYVSVPLSTSKDFQTFFNSVEDLASYTNVSNSCALHFHFGNVPRTESFINALWILVSIIQEDLYKLHQPYKMLNWGYKNKAYSKPLDSRIIAQMTPGNTVTENFRIIYDYLAEVERYSYVSDSLSNVHNHPQDRSNEHKWNIKHRYSIVNFIPLIFTNKQTVEFRISEATLDKQEIALEMLLFSKIVNFAKKNEKMLNDISKGLIKDLNLYTVLTGRYSDTLASYLRTRQEVVEYSYGKGSHDVKLNYLPLIVKTTSKFKVLDVDFLGKEKLNNVTSWLKEPSEERHYDNEGDEYFDDED